jgi:tetratricopeptide (TPR) repeat protein
MQLSLEQALREGIRAHKAGRFQEADKYYTGILKVKPKHPDANHNMGVLGVSIGRVKEALPFFKIALEVNPHVDQFWLSYIEALIKLDRLNDAKTVLSKANKKKPALKGFAQLEQKLKLASGKSPKALIPFHKQAVKIDNSRKVQDPPENQARKLVNLCIQKKFKKSKNQALKLLSSFPNSIVLYNIIGAANQGLGQLDHALTAYKKAVSIQPNFAEAHYNMGNVLQDQGNLEEAIIAFNKAVEIKSNYFEALNNMGNTLQDLGRLEEAIEAYNKAIRIKPNFAEALNNMGITLRAHGKLKEAIQTYNKALTIRPDYVEALNNKGNVYNDQGKLEKAIDVYKKAISFRPDYNEAWANGADLLEKWNKLEQLESWLVKAFLNFTDIPSDLKFYEAKLHWRQKRIKEAYEIISKITIEKISLVRQQDYLNLRAKCLEQLKDFDGAFKYYSEMNSLAKKSRDYQKSNPEKYFNEQCNQLKRLKSNQHIQPAKIPNKKLSFSPIFLVGFPRSGTTLLDTILRSHSKIDVVEEELSLSKAKAYIRKKGFTDALDQILPETLIEEARNTYHEEFIKHIKDHKSKAVYIDKMPLNILDAPLIHQLYPEAKIILALRHPVDTVLSCWMQNFKLNPAMANMTDLDRIVEFYCVAMETFKISRAKFKLDVYELKYENLLENLSSETSSLLSFLNLTWEQEMENYRDTANKRERINTPSYSQVIQPIYKDAKYRWLNYRKFLNAYMTKFKPWIQEFGYK